MEGITRMQYRHMKRASVLKVIKGVVVTLLLLALVSILYEAAHPKMSVATTKTYFVRSGDTLWDVAKRNTPEDMDVRVYIHTLFELNDGLTTDIRCGQAILLPLYENIIDNSITATGM